MFAFRCHFQLGKLTLVELAAGANVPASAGAMAHVAPAGTARFGAQRRFR
jgi:hypothetical protein